MENNESLLLENDKLLLATMVDIARDTLNSIVQEADRLEIDRDYAAERFDAMLVGLATLGTLKEWGVKEGVHE